MKWAAASLIFCLVAGFVIAWVAGTMMTRGKNSPVAPAMAPAQDVPIRTSDGMTLAATFRPGRSDRSPAVLLLHGVGASRAATAPNAKWFADQGYATLAIDFRGHGQSSPASRSFGLKESLDAQAAFDWLKTRQHRARVAIIGISLGGAAALIGDDGPVPADALILQAVYPDIRHAILNRIASRLTTPLAYLMEPLLSFQARVRLGVWPSRLSPIAALPRYHGPVFVIAGEQDRSTPPEETRRMFEAASDPKQMWLVATGDHATICDLTSPEYRDRIISFLRSSIGRPD